MVNRKPAPLSVPTTPTTSTPSVTITPTSVKLSLPSGPSAEILLYGATVISWKDSANTERLWLSEKAVLDGTKAVRGGIPLVFPVFGPDASGALPQHGFARISKWELLGKSDAEGEGADSVSVDLGLSRGSLSEDVARKWAGDFGLIYSVTLGRERLETKMVVRNEGESAFEFQTLFHTYLRVGDIAQVAVRGLKGVGYTDKVLKGQTATEESEELTVKGEVDRVYAGVPGAVEVLEGGRKRYEVQREGLEDVVVWNPWMETSRGIGDWAPEEGYKNMICIEAGAVAGKQKLEPQSVWEAGTVIHLKD